MTRSGVEVDGPQAQAAIAVVIPAYNRERTIGAAVASVLAQTYQRFRVVVVDDGSTDSTSEVVAAFTDPRVELLVRANEGAGAARNAGARAARAEYLTFLDSDDVALPDWLGTMVALLDAGADVVSVGCYAGPRGKPIEQMDVQLPRPLGRLFPEHHVHFAHGGTFAIRRDRFLQVGGYAEGLPASQHTELAYRLLSVADRERWCLRSVDRPLLVYHTGSEGSIRQSDEAVYRASRYVLEHHRALLGRDRRRLADTYAVAGVRAGRLGETAAAGKLLLRSALADPVRPRRWARLARWTASAAAGVVGRGGSVRP